MMGGEYSQETLESYVGDSDEVPTSVSSYAPPALRAKESEVSSILLMPLSKGMAIVRFAFWTVIALMFVATMAMSVVEFRNNPSIRTFFSLGR